MQMTRRDLAPRDGVERWLDSLAVDRTEETLSSYWYRLKLFVEWCESYDEIDSLQDLDGWLLDEYESDRRGAHPTTNTLKNELTTLRNFLEYCEGLGVVDGGLHAAVDPPTVPKSEQSSDVKLGSDAAEALLAHYRDSAGQRGSRGHALLEVLWHTAARVGEVRALDVEDLAELPDGRRYLVFRNREAKGTRLKKGQRGERAILLPDGVAAVLDTYVEDYRHEITDEYGRRPLFTSNQGRASKNALRQWSYRATVPCEHSPCPHDNDPATCEYLEHNRSSGCPSSRSPHQIRTGAITWLRDSGLSEEEVADRANATVETIRTHYDKQDPVREMLERRDQTLDIVDQTSTESDTNED
jgi:site-specific recombinase XerD